LKSSLEKKKIFPAQVKIIKAARECCRKIMSRQEETWKGGYNYWKEKGSF